MKDKLPEHPSHDARVIAIQEGIVQIRQQGPKPIIKNEIIYICPLQQQGTVPQRIMAEILHVKGDTAIAQVFEETSGIAIGDRVEQSGQQLSVTLGPGLLGMIYDGLQNPLINFASKYGFFLPRGVREHAIDPEKNGCFPQQFVQMIRCMEAGFWVWFKKDGLLIKSWFHLIWGKTFTSSGYNKALLLQIHL
nr:hypothetical protein [Legionella longbeachae]